MPWAEDAGCPGDQPGSSPRNSHLRKVQPPSHTSCRRTDRTGRGGSTEGPQAAPVPRGTGLCFGGCWSQDTGPCFGLSLQTCFPSSSISSRSLLKAEPRSLTAAAGGFAARHEQSPNPSFPPRVQEKMLRPPARVSVSGHGRHRTLKPETWGQTQSPSPCTSMMHRGAGEGGWCLSFPAEASGVTEPALPPLSDCWLAVKPRGYSSGAGRGSVSSSGEKNDLSVSSNLPDVLYFLRP